MIDKVMIEEIIENLAGFDIVVSLLSSATNLVSLVAYVLTAYSLYTIANRRGIKHAWLAWVPVLQLWVVGAIADDYQLKAKNTVTRKRRVMVWLMVVNAILAVVLFVAVCGAVLAILAAGYNSYEDWTDWAGVIGSFSGLILIAILLAGISLTMKIVEYFALYDVYSSCDPGNALLFVLLNVFVAITKPIFLLLCHQKDNGIPAVSEPWENI